jgi:hypothetical protein
MTKVLSESDKRLAGYERRGCNKRNNARTSTVLLENFPHAPPPEVDIEIVEMF